MADKKEGVKLNIPNRCKNCGEDLGSLKISDYQVKSLTRDENALHVCDKQKVISYKKEWDDLIKKAHEEQAEIMKSKEINEDILKIRFNV